MNESWKQIFHSRQETATVNCPTCFKPFKSKCGLQVHVTKVHRKPKKSKKKDEAPDKKKEEKKEEKNEEKQGSRARKKRKRYSMDYKTKVLKRLENKTAQQRKEILEKYNIPKKTLEKWKSPARKRQIQHDAVLHPFRKRKVTKIAKKSGK